MSGLTPGGTNWPSDAYRKNRVSSGAGGQRIFRSPGDAFHALIGAMNSHDQQRLTDILGPEGEKLSFQAIPQPKGKWLARILSRHTTRGSGK